MTTTQNGEKETGRPVRVRKRPVEHDAILYTGRNCAEVAAFLGDDVPLPCDCDGAQAWAVTTLHGIADAEPGDWIVKGERDCWPVDAEQFEATYEVVGSGSEEAGQ